MSDYSKHKATSVVHPNSPRLKHSGIVERVGVIPIYAGSMFLLFFLEGDLKLLGIRIS